MDSVIKKRKSVRSAKDFKGTLKRLLHYLRPHKFRLLLVLLTAVLSTAFTILSPKIMGLATTEIFSGMVERLYSVRNAGIDFGKLLQILIVLGGLYILSVLFSYIQQFLIVGISQNVIFTLRKEVNEKLARLPLSFFDSRKHGDILSRAMNDIENISSSIQQTLTQLITSLLTLVGVLVMMLTISPLLTLIVLLTLPLSYLVTAKIAARAQVFFREQQKSLGKLNSHVEEMYSGHDIVKAFGLEKKSTTKFNDMNEKLYDSGWKAQFVSGLIMPLMSFINNIGYVFVCVAGGILVTRNTIQIGDIQAFIQYVRQFSQPITRVSTIANIVQSTVASAERVFEILDEQEELPDASASKVISSPKSFVEFHNVSFSYQEGEPMIEDLNISVKKGQKVAIVGPTGAGKTTLINLLMRFYEINSGRITIDDVDIRDLKRSDLRSLFGIVLQDTWLFTGSIRDNIAYGSKAATEEAIVRASKAANADYFIRTLSDGYDTILNEEASNISQGQKQLLTIARAILADPAILILDEATSNVDTRTEVHIQRALKVLMEGKTSFIIAHRLSTIQNADVILVMDHGKVIEKGSHKELLLKEGFYANLYKNQFTRDMPQNNALQQTVG
ncbi:ABC transporter ATP-binding protein [Peribacillus cavernae]|uniref:ABC transporter ATP-binding protein n=1 Tax=Peribacillus cavernae TaxID=1674310 RepID=A0A3S0TXK4_9BACI|nr:ABC transporter ATP-binding protein [Peribacillus cavernae]RUQ26993.1 ABC transporter ATP-binding protein [Peribacillus cavernae]